MSFLKKVSGADVNTSEIGVAIPLMTKNLCMEKITAKYDIDKFLILKQGKETVQDAANQCVQEGQKIAQEAIDKGCQAAKDAGDKAVDQLKTGIKYK